jgi:hypothetical protein
VGNAAVDGTTAGNVSSSAELVHEKENQTADAKGLLASQRNWQQRESSKGAEAFPSLNEYANLQFPRCVHTPREELEEPLALRAANPRLAGSSVHAREALV